MRTLRTSPKHWLVAILLVILTAFGASPSPVGADNWCEADPIIRLNGTTTV